MSEAIAARVASMSLTFVNHLQALGLQPLLKPGLNSLRRDGRK